VWLARLLRSTSSMKRSADIAAINHTLETLLSRSSTEATSSDQQCQQSDKEETTRLPREDVRALALGIGVSFALTFIVKALEYRLRDVPHEPEKGPFIYYWVLPNPTAVTRLSAWGLYACHQISHWGLIYYAQTHIKKTTAKLHPVNYAALAVNLFFSVVHIIQTHTFYDGLAQDVPEISALGAVAILLIWVLLMENYTRGMVAGRPLPLSKELVRFARKYHAYYFSWAIIYTFWYHPMEATTGHLWGFFYTFLLLLQGSLFFTKIHLNPWWKLALELIVAPHGVIVALNQRYTLWPMFLYGFLSVFVITQMHIREIGSMVKLASVLILASGFFYYWNKPLHRFNEPLRVPIMDYVGVLLLAGILYTIMKGKVVVTSFMHILVKQAN
jgi:hypothetical protein